MASFRFTQSVKSLTLVRKLSEPGGQTHNFSQTDKVWMHNQRLGYFCLVRKRHVVFNEHKHMGNHSPSIENGFLVFRRRLSSKLNFENRTFDSKCLGMTDEVHGILI